MVIPSLEKSHVSGVTGIQNSIVAVSLNPVLCLMQWDGKISYLTALRDFYSLILALFEGMAACRLYWSHCFTEEQKLPEPLSGCGWYNCPQHTCCKTQHLLKCESSYLHRRACPQCAAITSGCGLWSLGWFSFFYTPSWSTGASANDSSLPHWHCRAEPLCIVSCCTITKSKC